MSDKMAEALREIRDIMKIDGGFPNTVPAINEVLTAYESEKSLLEKTQDWHQHGAVAPSCVGCPTAEAEIENAICVYDTGESCPSCGNSMVSIQTDWFDGESVFCIECGERGALSIDEDGNQWLQAEAEIEHPDDRLSREAGLAMNIELDGKYTRVITERLDLLINAWNEGGCPRLDLKSYCSDCEYYPLCQDYNVNPNETKNFVTGKDDHETN